MKMHKKMVSRHKPEKVVFSEAEDMNVWGSLRKTCLVECI